MLFTRFEFDQNTMVREIKKRTERAESIPP